MLKTIAFFAIIVSKNRKKDVLLLKPKMIDFITKFKEKTEKECCTIDVIDGTPGILDNKIGGIPYLPVGEKYPVSKEGEPLALLLQVNCKDISIPDFPPEGIFEIFLDKDVSWPSEYEIRLFKEGLPYEKDLPEVDCENFVINKSVKIAIKKEKCHMPISDFRFDDVALSVIKDLTGEAIGDFIDIEKIFGKDIYKMLDEQLHIPQISIGGYPDFTQEDPRYEKEHSDKTECIFKLDSCYDDELFWLGDAGILFVLISKENLKSKKLSEALLDWDCY